MNTIDFDTILDSISTIFKEKSSILIVIKGSPDPDAIATSYFLHEYAKLFDCKTQVYAAMSVSLPQNQAMLSRLSIPLHYKLPDLSQFEGYAIVDFQSAFVEEVSEKLSCLIHIDHHAKGKEEINVHFSFLTEKINSCSTLMAGLLLKTKNQFDDKKMSKMATAISYGIQTDTDMLAIASSIDKELYNSVKEYADNDLLTFFNEIPYSEETLTLISKAMLGSVYFKDWLIAGIGIVPISTRDSLAITADFLLGREDVTTVVVFALIEGKNELFIDASFRSKDRFLDLNSLIKRITPNGGGRKHKGAFQHDVSYFKKCKDRVLLWQFAREATLANLKQARENLRMHEVKNLFEDLKERFHDIFQ